VIHSQLPRKVAFFALDAARGGRVRRHLRDLDRQFADRDQMRDASAQRLDALLKHAAATTDFYSGRRGRELEDFPVVTKDVLKRGYGAFLSRSIDCGDLVEVTTSGSYGTPFTYLLSPEKKARQTAEVIFFGRWSGYDIGVRHAYIRVTRTKRPLTLFLQNEVLMDPSSLSEAWLAQQRAHLRRSGVRVIIGYPSGVGALAAYCRDQGDAPADFRLRGVITTAEPLLPEVRRATQETFGCRVLSRYSTEELGVLANERADLQMHCVNAASYHVEVLRREADEPAAPGEMGRVVVTDLFSHAFPLIRYDTGDLAVLSDEQTERLGVPVLERLEGRAVEEIRSTNGNRVSPFAINGVMRDVENVLQFQFVERGASDYLMRLVVHNGFAAEAGIRERLGAILGEGAHLEIERVEEIPALPSGKRPYILSERGYSRSCTAQ